MGMRQRLAYVGLAVLVVAVIGAGAWWAGATLFRVGVGCQCAVDGGP